MVIENLNSYFIEFEKKFMPKNFSWRPGQKEAILEIINTYLEKKYETVILDAPVGSGKSIIALCSSWILNKIGKEGYILSSDISLQDQYEIDLQRFNINWGSIKGLDNYTCIDNGEKTSMGSCKIQGKEPRKMYCYNSCPYYTSRQKASDSNTSILNYAYWLTMMNDVNPRVDEDKQAFPQRDFIFCDEAHKILDIVQNSYSPRFSDRTIDKISNLSEFFNLHNVKNLSQENSMISDLYRAIKAEEDQHNLLGLLISFSEILDLYIKPIRILKDRVSVEYFKKPPAEWKKALWISDWLIEFSNRIKQYIFIIEKTSHRDLIKNPSVDEIVFNCLEERYLMHRYFLKHTGFRVLMSATFSDPSEYIKSLSIKDAKYIKMESQFNFEKSPIYFYNSRKMSYTNMESNIPWMIEKINSIIEQNQGKSGLIHSASYNLALKIYNGLGTKNRKRVLIYSGTEEKRNSLEEFKASKDKILLGPSLLEGLDLKDDLGRFQIFAKVPYLSLGDRFVKAKMSKNPGWYQHKAAINIEQGIGRIVRSENDWGVTYILDGSLGDLIHRNRKLFSRSFYSRLRVIPE